MRVRHLVFLSAICIACFLLSCPAVQAEEETGACPKPAIRSLFPWAARPGDLVTIQGRGFGAKRGEVIFAHESEIEELIFPAAEIKAEIVNWTYRRIWVIVPKSAATGPVFVRVSCGAESNKLEFTMNK